MQRLSPQRGTNRQTDRQTDASFIYIDIVKLCLFHKWLYLFYNSLKLICVFTGQCYSGVIRLSVFLILNYYMLFNCGIHLSYLFIPICLSVKNTYNLDLNIWFKSLVIIHCGCCIILTANSLPVKLAITTRMTHNHLSVR